MLFLKKHFKRLVFICLFIVFITIIVIIQTPSKYPSGEFVFSIKNGDSISKVADTLEERDIIASSFIFKISSIIISFNKGVMVGDYKFNKKENAIKIAYRMVNGYQKQDKVRITIPEGTNSADMAYIFLKKLPNFNTAQFLALAKPKEGYLYPDTYDFYENVTPREIVGTMTSNFNKKIEAIDDKIKGFDKSMKEIITMASIVEKESNDMEDRKIISGILWKRIKEGIPLQVDPPFYYITGKTNGVTYDDLKIDSPYNTYRNKGLPIGPISNPGIKAIEATISPVSSKYYFYLTGKDGIMRYAITYNGHLNNKNIYLK